MGGHEDQNYRLFIQEDIENPQLNYPGFYRNYSAEINISYLYLNTILKSDQMKEFSVILNPVKAVTSKGKKEINQYDNSKQENNQ